MLARCIDRAAEVLNPGDISGGSGRTGFCSVPVRELSFASKGLNCHVGPLPPRPPRPRTT
eukprot:3610531-Pyramimonas_sp.AAC.1